MLRTSQRDNASAFDDASEQQEITEYGDAASRGEVGSRKVISNTTSNLTSIDARSDAVIDSDEDERNEQDEIEINAMHEIILRDHIGESEARVQQLKYKSDRLHCPVGESLCDCGDNLDIQEGSDETKQMCTPHKNFGRLCASKCAAHGIPRAECGEQCDEDYDHP